MSYENVMLASNAKWVHEHSAEVKIKQINGHQDSVNFCQLIRNDQVVFSASNDNTVRLWNFDTGEELICYKNLHNAIIPKAKVSADNKKFITCSWDRTVKCWDLETGKLLWSNSHEYLVTSCDFTYGHDKYVISVSDVDLLVKIWDVNTGNLVMNVNDLHSSTITACGFSPKNDRIVTTSMDRYTKFFDMVAKKNTITLGCHSGVISNFSFTPDERKFATCSWDKTIQIWDISTGMYRKNGPLTLSKAHDGSVSSCCLSNDGMLCVSGGYDNKLILWDANHGIPKLILRGHLSWLNHVTISNDNKWIISAGKDKEIREWDIENCDNIKLVVEQNRNFGNKLINCSTCNRAFTIAKLEKSGEFKMNCVFCRLQERIAENQSSNNNVTSVLNTTSALNHSSLGGSTRNMSSLN